MTKLKQLADEAEQDRLEDLRYDSLAAQVNHLDDKTDILMVLLVVSLVGVFVLGLTLAR